MQINSLGSVGAVQQAGRTNSVKSPTSTQPAAVGTPTLDQLDFSPEAQQILASQEASGSSGDIRTDKVASIREAIANGTYETPEKLSQALDKLFDSLV